MRRRRLSVSLMSTVATIELIFLSSFTMSGMLHHIRKTRIIQMYYHSTFLIQSLCHHIAPLFLMSPQSHFGSSRHFCQVANNGNEGPGFRLHTSFLGRLTSITETTPRGGYPPLPSVDWG